MLMANQSSLVDSLLHGYYQDTLELINKTPDLNFIVTLENLIRTVSPLHLACTHLKAERLVQAMIDKGANAYVFDHEGKTPLHYAQDNDKLAAAKILVNHQHDLRTIPDNDKRTPLHEAAYDNKLNFLKLYLSNNLYKCNVDVPAEENLTPLHFAARCGHMEAVKMLLSYGANVHARCDANYTPADSVIRFPEVKALLKEKMFPKLFLLSAQALALNQSEFDSIPSTVKEIAEKRLAEDQKNKQMAEEKEALYTQKLKNALEKGFYKLRI